MTLVFLGHPRYCDAHPDEECPTAGYDCKCGPCIGCALACNPEEHGPAILLWRSNGVHWALSRHDPRYGTDERIEVTHLIFHHSPA